MEKKFQKLELIEVPMSELEQAALDDILAGWWCSSYSIGGGSTSCGEFYETGTCSIPGQGSGDFCKLYSSVK